MIFETQGRTIDMERVDVAYALRKPNAKKAYVEAFVAALAEKTADRIVSNLAIGVDISDMVSANVELASMCAEIIERKWNDDDDED